MTAEVVKIPILLTEREAAEILDISLPTLRRMAKSGEIGCYEYARKRKFSEDQITAYLELVECPEKKKSGHTEDFSSRADTTAQTGTDVSMIRKPTRLSRVPSALATKKRRNAG